MANFFAILIYSDVLLAINKSPKIIITLNYELIKLYINKINYY